MWLSLKTFLTKRRKKNAYKCMIRLKNENVMEKGSAIFSDI